MSTVVAAVAPSLVVSPDKKSSRRSTGSDLEDALYLQITLANLPLPERQYLFAKALKRRFAFDFCWPHHLPKVALEVEGGIWIGGRHTRGSGFIKDIEKYNIAGLLSYRVFRCTRAMIEDGTALTLIEHALSLSS